MNQFKLSQPADQDLQAIWAYVGQNDELAADRLMVKILDRLPMLAQFPDMGRDRDEISPGFKSFPVKIYIIFDRKVTIGIEIIRILHQSRDAHKALRSDEES